MNIVTLARTVATIAHEGQTDKNGAPYIGHPERVAGYVTTDEEKAVAWLHDVIEDTAVTAEDLLELGFSHRIVNAVVLLTRRKGVSSEEYYAAIRKDPLALAGKKADIKDNTSPERVKLLPKETQERLAKKYSKALSLLQD